MKWLVKVLRLGLYPLSWLYRLGGFFRNFAYDNGLFKSHSSPVPTISIGNLSMGGTGKTPMAEYLIRELIQRGLRPGYLSRGYGRDTKGYRRVDPTEDSFREVGDEALQVATKFSTVPVAVCEDRVLGATTLTADAPIDVLVLDDAFQHRRIRRNVDIVMIDANRPPWDDHLFPAGALREPRSSLNRADLVVVSKLSNHKQIPRYKHRINRPLAFSELTPTALVRLGQPERLTLAEIKDVNAITFSALGNNQDFFESVRAAGLRTIETYSFADHHAFTPNEIGRISRRYRKLAKQDVFTKDIILVTSEKDAVRLTREPWFAMQVGHLPLYYLEVELRLFEGKGNFEQQLSQLSAANASYRAARR